MADAVQRELHNRLAGQIVASIVKPPLEAGGTSIDVLILFESVAVGVMLALTKLGGDEIVFDTIAERVKERLADLRLRDIATGGSA